MSLPYIPICVRRSGAFRAAAALFSLFVCLVMPGSAADGVPTPTVPPAVQEERDLIYTMLANAVVYKQWQPDSPTNRGFNIGSVLVNPAGEVVGWAVNCVNVLGSWTQHGEVRLMLEYGLKNRVSRLLDFTVYTTLEPCAQCSGMMTLQGVGRTVYCQHDPGFGDALQRLQFDGTEKGGFKPYPFPVRSEQSPSAYAKRLNELYAARLKEPLAEGARPVRIVDFLYRDEAKDVFAQSTTDLKAYQPKYPENARILKLALDLLDRVPDHYVPLGISL